VRRLTGVVALAAAALLALGAAGCVDSEPDAARTPEGTPTVINSAPQTDSEGRTVPAPGATETQPAGTAPAGAAEGDVAAGREFFAKTCQGCHANLGQQAAVGPKLAGRGLQASVIRQTVQNGRGAMPAGLAQGEDLDNVVAFVASIQ